MDIKTLQSIHSFTHSLLYLFMGQIFIECLLYPRNTVMYEYVPILMVLIIQRQEPTLNPFVTESGSSCPRHHKPKHWDTKVCSKERVYLQGSQARGRELVSNLLLPRPGVETELQLLAYVTATATWDPSHIFDLHHSSWQCWILTHWGRPGIKPASSWILVEFVNRWATEGTPKPWRELR